MDEAEWTDYGKLIEIRATMLVADGSHVTVCTTAQLANHWLKNIKSDWIIFDEGTNISEAQLVQIWSESTDLIMMISDHTQLGPTPLSKQKENPNARSLENGYPYHTLQEVMRVTAGLEVICNDMLKPVWEYFYV